jgi:hypothetical protein
MHRYLESWLLVKKNCLPFRGDPALAGEGFLLAIGMDFKASGFSLPLNK